MKLSKRLVFSILFVAIILLFGMFFWPFILKDIIEPVALVTWLLLRIFVLSIDQKYYWGVAIFILLLSLFRFLPQEHTIVSPPNSAESNVAMKTIGYWRILFAPAGPRGYSQDSMKRELIHLLISHYASKQHRPANYTVYSALQSGELPLPKHIHMFLFPEKPRKSGRSLIEFMQSIESAPRKWMRRWTGQEAAEYYRMIDEVLRFMESSMEMKNDDGKFTAIRH